MTHLTETAGIGQLPRHVNVGGLARNLDYSLLEKTHLTGMIESSSRQLFESNTTKGVCPCCGAELKNQRPRIDLNTNTFIFRDAQLKVSPTQAELLETLIRRSPGVVTHDTIIRHLWGADEPQDPRKNIQVHICRLRVLLAPLGVSIVNVLDVGYRFCIEGEV